MASSSYSGNCGQPMQQQNNHQQQPHHRQVASSSHSHFHTSSPANALASPVVSRQTTIVDENFIVQDYRPPGTRLSPGNPSEKDDPHNEHKHISTARKKVQWMYNPVDGSVLLDHNGIPLSVDRMLATKPLRHELSTRPGPGNKKLTYISGDDVSRTLNDVFGFDGWDLDIKDVSRIDASKDPKTGKHTIVYTARVRVTHKASGAYKEECGVGDSIDKSYATAIAHALKASITDAMKRAARHFGDKLGNCECVAIIPFCRKLRIIHVAFVQLSCASFPSVD